MEFKQYSSYKNSGVEWLGDVPEHWNLKRFCYLFAENKKKNIGLKETNVLSLSYGNIKEKKIDDNKGLLPESFETYQIIEPNDIVFRFTDLQNDKRSLRSAISKYHGIITSACIAVKTKQNADFYNYLFRAYDLQKVFYSMGEGMRQSLKMDELNKMPVVLPSEDEQKRIVAFLNTETTRIDNLITKQEKLIELLEEQRKSIISHAVTKGLNPDAPMKDSGVEWLGDVPEHWQQKPIWSLFKRIKRTNFPTERLLSVYRDYGVIPKDSRDDNHNRASEDLTPYQLVCANDLVINKMKAWQGSIAISELRGIVSPAYYIYQPKAEYHSKYIHFLIRSAYYIQSYKNYSKGIRVNQWDLESEAFTHIDLLLPSLDEQQKIVAFLDTETARIDNLISKQKSLIEKLKEYRTSIISHAVTGKIDVREFGA